MFCKPGFDFLVHALYTIPSNYLEIGVFNSDSIANIATIYPSKKIYGIDPFIEDGYTSHVTDVNRGELLSQQKQNTLNNIKDLQNVEGVKMAQNEFLEKYEKQISLEYILTPNIIGYRLN
jgi:tRNA G46 methylase TrmB